MIASVETQNAARGMKAYKHCKTAGRVLSRFGIRKVERALRARLEEARPEIVLHHDEISCALIPLFCSPLSNGNKPKSL